ncbi:ActS/PrrB/RegB family redox-sensitive histidine kinase [Agrobacterium vitis]|uniref:histidine kinase n=2 Tax=Agrobacterium vitis TaxID=373 RepID=A0ABD6GJW0_AGRVI|nr:ActS/PrrB/RegB family redox-sensitive histidine kinase [Agrobacterium vitis]MUO82344.1 ActS/PrrB/RegB family redox-sensitive histidine kinase [Agrobacterium vitis]MUO97734.1 ActS/PrrB/RegB family redox-sensitive histidine kinase [Agrobacterium vitis]MUP08195.1 ActS/PrrB/RegB family redox-sensitive histidine kinase [Agrobacterium vitis]MVA12464.1 ActS/PrrB/RegB family redox-sensitive histidine kinase [Agrobacterium vitis]MVA95548.1 ActS/PrrB/RegB family redox-sensitive histidine kinase [Agro
MSAKTDIRMHFGTSSRRLRLETLVRLRWLAVAGQTITLAIVALVLQFPMPVLAAAILIGALAVVNFLLQLAFPSTQRLEPIWTLAILALDLFQMGALLFITGGLANPFAPLICVPVIVVFASQPLRHSMALLGLAMVCISVQAFTPFPLPWYADYIDRGGPVMLTAIWCSIVSMTAFAAFYAYRVSKEANLLADALAATELVLQKEKHLSQLDGLAAAAAHELGTPLATISVVAKEMERELGKDPRFGEDVQLLRSQSERCRDILKRLTTLSAEDEAHMRQLPLSSLIEEVIAPHRDFGIKLTVVEVSDRTSEPVGNRNPGILYGLGNLIENALDYARDQVTITVEHDNRHVTIMIEDDGEGFAPDILLRIGEPYVTSRKSDARAGGLGLGLFIAKTLLERSGAVLTFENRGVSNPGARVTVRWPRREMETPTK